MEDMNNDNQQNNSNEIDLNFIGDIVGKIRYEAEKLLIGQNKLFDLLLAALFADGHILLEGVPGIAKTLSAKILARTLDCGFSRIQFTPDLMPSDVLGTSVFNPKTIEFDFKPGPIFSNIILIDEINRAPAKTQSALFEAMEERQATIDGISYQFEQPFLVLATQNPIEHEGTYSLPEAQTDRFLFKIKMDYPEPEDELKILELKHKTSLSPDLSLIKPVLNAGQLAKIRLQCSKVRIEHKLLNYIVSIVSRTRNNHSLFLGASPRASIGLMAGAKAVAAINSRDFVIPEDIRFISMPVLNHRIIASPEKEMEGVSSEDLIREIIDSVEIPR